MYSGPHGARRIDVLKANNLLLEGNQVPFSSRIKDQLRIKLKHLVRQENGLAAGKSQS